MRVSPILSSWKLLVSKMPAGALGSAGKRSPCEDLDNAAACCSGREVPSNWHTGCPGDQGKGGRPLELLPFPCCISSHLWPLWLPKAALRACEAEADAFPEVIQPPHGGCWIIKGCCPAARVSRNLTPHLPLGLGQRGLQPWCPEESLPH